MRLQYISYQGIYDGTNFEDAATPKQITKAMNAGFSTMVNVWRIEGIFGRIRTDNSSNRKVFARSALLDQRYEY